MNFSRGAPFNWGVPPQKKNCNNSRQVSRTNNRAHDDDHDSSDSSYESARQLELSFTLFRDTREEEEESEIGDGFESEDSQVDVGDINKVELEQELDEADREYGEEDRDYDEADREYGEAERELDESGREYGETEREYDEADREYGETERELDESGREYGDSGSEDSVDVVEERAVDSEEISIDTETDVSLNVQEGSFDSQSEANDSVNVQQGSFGWEEDSRDLEQNDRDEWESCDEEDDEARGEHRHLDTSSCQCSTQHGTLEDILRVKLSVSSMARLYELAAGSLQGLSDELEKYGASVPGDCVPCKLLFLQRIRRIMEETELAMAGIVRGRNDNRRQVSSDTPATRPEPEVSPHEPWGLCVICCDKVRDCAFIPCGHVACCLHCASSDRIDCCPACRADIEDVQILYVI